VRREEMQKFALLVAAAMVFALAVVTTIAAETPGHAYARFAACFRAHGAHVRKGGPPPPYPAEFKRGRLAWWGASWRAGHFVTWLLVPKTQRVVAHIDEVRGNKLTRRETRIVNRCIGVWHVG
jgi:hypothetical protein